jgi:endonuclease IV
MYIENKKIASEIIQHFEKKLENPEAIILTELEAKFKNEFGVTYQGVKDYINGLYNDGICQDTCYKYAKKNEVVEFKTLIKDYESKV